MVPVGSQFDSIVQIKRFKADNMNSVYKFVLSEMYYGKPKSKNKNDEYYPNLPFTIKEGITKDSVVKLFQLAIENKDIDLLKYFRVDSVEYWNERSQLN